MPTRPPGRDELAARLRRAGCVFAEDEADLLLAAPGTPAELEALAARRVAGEPLEQVLGWAELCGVRVLVEPGVFVPRRRSELLVREGVRRVRLLDPAREPGGRLLVVDLCCGTGAVGLAVSTLLTADGTRVDLHVADVDPLAVACARRNVSPLGGHAHQGDLFAALPAGLAGRVDVLVCNAPYVPTDAISLMPPEARDHEPRTALDGGADGLEVQRRVAAQAAGWLRPGGILLVETSQAQAAGTVEAFTGGGLGADVVRCDDLDATVVVGTRPVD